MEAFWKFASENPVCTVLIVLIIFHNLTSWTRTVKHIHTNEKDEEQP